jgi:hypothetical protein
MSRLASFACSIISPTNGRLSVFPSTTTWLPRKHSSKTGLKGQAEGSAGTSKIIRTEPDFLGSELQSAELEAIEADEQQLPAPATQCRYNQPKQRSKIKAQNHRSSTKIISVFYT